MNNYSEPIIVLAGQQLCCMPFWLRRTLLHTTQCTLRQAANTSLPAEFSIVDGNWLLWTIAVNVHNREGFKEKV